MRDSILSTEKDVHARAPTHGCRQSTCGQDGGTKKERCACWRTPLFAQSPHMRATLFSTLLHIQIADTPVADFYLRDGAGAQTILLLSDQRARISTPSRIASSLTHCVSAILQWWAEQGLNLRPPACDAGALPTELSAHCGPTWIRTRDRPVMSR